MTIQPWLFLAFGLTKHCVEHTYFCLYLRAFTKRKFDAKQLQSSSFEQRTKV